MRGLKKQKKTKNTWKKVFLNNNRKLAFCLTGMDKRHCLKNK